MSRNYPKDEAEKEYWRLRGNEQARASWKKNREKYLEQRRKAGPSKYVRKLHNRDVAAQYYIKNRDKILAANTAWRLAHKEASDAQRKAYYEANRDRINARRRELTQQRRDRDWLRERTGGK